LCQQRLLRTAVGQVVPVAAVGREERVAAGPEVWVKRCGAELLSYTGVDGPGDEPLLKELEESRLEDADAERLRGHGLDRALARSRGHRGQLLVTAAADPSRSVTRSTSSS